MYICSNCKKEFKRVPVEAICYSNVTFLLCRFCKGTIRQPRDSEFMHSIEELKELKAIFPLNIITVSSERLGRHRDWIWYESILRLIRGLEPLGTFYDRRGRGGSG
jgi:hypothetical protein